MSRRRRRRGDLLAATMPLEVAWTLFRCDLKILPWPWWCDHVGRLGVHASRNPHVTFGAGRITARAPVQESDGETGLIGVLSVGAMLGRISHACEDRRLCERWGCNWAWPILHRELLERPMPLRGRAGFFRVPEDVWKP